MATLPACRSAATVRSTAPPAQRAPVVRAAAQGAWRTARRHCTVYATPAGSRSRRAARRGLQVRASMEDLPDSVKLAMEQNPQLKQLVEQAKDNPEVMARLREADAALSKQMQESMAIWNRPEVRQRMEELKQDPELKDAFAEIAAGGQAAMQKYWNDETFLRKVSEKMGDLMPQAAGAGAAPSPQEPPDVNSLIDAARVGDVEAAEDFLAVGKDPNEADEESRTAVHTSIAFGHADVLDLLLAAEGVDVNAKDSGGNTPLMYAVGYGRVDMLRSLLEAEGLDATIKNKKGQTPYDLVQMDERNPILKEEELVADLQAKAEAAPFFADQ